MNPRTGRTGLVRLLRLAAWNVAAALSSLAASAQTPIAVEAPAEFSISAAFDGTNYLVALQGGASSAAQVTAQRVSPSGVLVGPRIDTFRTGSAPLVEFGAGNYLMVWADDAFHPNDDLVGVFVSPAGVLGSPFGISTSGQPEERAGLAFDGANFLVAYTKVIVPATGVRGVRARLVSPAAVVGSEIDVSAGAGAHGLDDVAFGGGRYLVAWTDDGDDATVRARLVFPSGALGTLLTLDASPTPSDSGVSVAFDGFDFLVVWAEETGGAGSDDWQVLAQRVSTAGAIVGAPFAVSTPSQRAQNLAFAAGGLGTVLVTWTDAHADIDADGVCDGDETTCWNIVGRFVAGGMPSGPDFSIAFSAGNQWGSPAALGGARYLVAWTDGTVPGGATSDVYAGFVDPLLPRAPALYCTSKLNSLGCTPLITWSGMPDVSSPAAFDIGAVNLRNQKSGLLFYGVSGPSSAPFQGGYLCAQPPTRRTPLQSSGGTPAGDDCSGNFHFDFNQYVQSGADPALHAGSDAWTQYWSRDPASPSTTSLSDALQFTLEP